MDKFKTHTNEIELQHSRSYDHQEALSEGSHAIMSGFELVRNAKAEYGILHKDTQH